MLRRCTDDVIGSILALAAMMVDSIIKSNFYLQNNIMFDSNGIFGIHLVLPDIFMTNKYVN